MSNNPYQPGKPPEAMFGQDGGPHSRNHAISKLSFPVNCLLVVGALSVFASVIGLLLPLLIPQSFIDNLVEMMAANPEINDAQLEQFRSDLGQIKQFNLLNVASSLVGTVSGVVMCLGGLKMKRLESHTFCVVANVLAIAPITSACCVCIFPIAIGIWGIVVLNDAAIKQQFV